MDDRQAPLPPEPLSWNLLMEALVAGAMHGMAQTHASLEDAGPGTVPALSDLTMYRAAEVMAATLLEDSAECKEERDFAKASRMVGRNILGYLKALRRQRNVRGESALSSIIERAGLERHRAQ
jgi:hypothetical protein